MTRSEAISLMVDATYYQEHKDDPDEWDGAVPTRRPESRRLAAMVSVRFSPEEEALLRVEQMRIRVKIADAARRGAAFAGDGAETPVRRAAIQGPARQPVHPRHVPAEEGRHRAQPGGVQRIEHGLEAAQIYLAVAENSSATDALPLRRHAAEQFLRSGHVKDGLAQLEVVLKGVGLSLPKSAPMNESKRKRKK